MILSGDLVDGIASVAWYLNGKRATADPRNANTRCPQSALIVFLPLQCLPFPCLLISISSPSLAYTVLVTLTDPNLDRKRQKTETRNITSINLRGIRLAVATRTKLPLPRASVVQPTPIGAASTPLFLNVTILPPDSRKKLKRQSSASALSEITTADAAARLLTPGTYGSSALSQSLAENGVGRNLLSPSPFILFSIFPFFALQ